jgi:hypothetical protein
MINEGANCIGGVVVNVLTSNVVDRGFSPDQVKPKIIMVFVVSPQSMQHYKEKDQRLDNVSEWSDMSICRLLFQ